MDVQARQTCKLSAILLHKRKGINLVIFRSSKSSILWVDYFLLICDRPVVDYVEEGRRQFLLRAFMFNIFGDSTPYLIEATKQENLVGVLNPSSVRSRAS